MHSEQEQGSIIQHEYMKCDNMACRNTDWEKVLIRAPQTGQHQWSGPDINLHLAAGGVHSNCTHILTMFISQFNIGFSQLLQVFQYRLPYFFKNSQPVCIFIS